jgi:hypothetical protein
MVLFLPCLPFSSSQLILTAVAHPIYTGFWFSLDICFGSAWNFVLVQSGYLFWFSLDVCFGSFWIFVLVQPGYLFWFSLDICFGSAWIIVLVQPG